MPEESLTEQKPQPQNAPSELNPEQKQKENVANDEPKKEENTPLKEGYSSTYKRIAIGCVIAIVFGIILLMILASMAKKFFSNIPTTPVGLTPDVETVEDPRQPLTISDIAKDPDIYVGKDVELKGVVSDWVTEQAVMLDGFQNEGELFGLPLVGGSLLVIRRETFLLPEQAPKTEPALGETNKLVEFSGRVEKLNVDNIQNIVGSQLDTTKLQPYQNTPVVILNKIKLAKGE